MKHSGGTAALPTPARAPCLRHADSRHIEAGDCLTDCSVSQCPLRLPLLVCPPAVGLWRSGDGGCRNFVLRHGQHRAAVFLGTPLRLRNGLETSFAGACCAVQMACCASGR